MAVAARAALTMSMLHAVTAHVVKVSTLLSSNLKKKIFGSAKIWWAPPGPPNDVLS